jgi:hypothetical protein
MSTQDAGNNKGTDRDNNFAERELKVCNKCGKMAKHRTNECEGEAFKPKRVYMTNYLQSNKRKDSASDDDNYGGQREYNNSRSNDSRKRVYDSDSEDNNVMDKLRKYNLKTKSVNFDGHVYAHMTNLLSERVYSVATKIFSDEAERRTHEGFNNTYAARSAEGEPTEPNLVGEDAQNLFLGESPDISDGGDTSTLTCENVGDATKPVLRLRGGGSYTTEGESLYDQCSDDEESVSSSSSHSSMPAACYCDSSSIDDDSVNDGPGTASGINDDYSLAVFAEEPPTLVDDASSDSQSDNGDDDFGNSHESESYPSDAGNCWDERAYLVTPVTWYANPDDGIVEPCAENEVIIKSKVDMVKTTVESEINSWGYYYMPECNKRGHRLPDELRSDRKFTPAGISENECFEDSKTYCPVCLTFRPTCLFVQQKCHQQCQVCKAVGTPVDIATGLCHSRECVICHCKDTHLSGDGVEKCELSRGMLQYHRETLHTAIRLLRRELDYRMEHYCYPQLDVVLSAYKDLLRMRYDIRELEVMLVPIRKRVYRFQLEEDEAAKIWGSTAHGPPRRPEDPRDYGEMLEDGYLTIPGSSHNWRLYMFHLVEGTTTTPGTKAPGSRETTTSDLSSIESINYELYRAMPERRAEIEAIVLQQFFDAEGMSTDRVLKRERKLKDLLRSGKSFEVLCSDWFTWLVQQQDEESKLDMQTNSSVHTETTSTPPNESS